MILSFTHLPSHSPKVHHQFDHTQSIFSGGEGLLRQKHSPPAWAILESLSL